MNQNKIVERLRNGIIQENPIFVLMLGMCPTLAVTTSAMNGLGMGLTTMVVLSLSNMFISLLRKVIPDKVRIPAFIVIIASFVTVAELLLKAYIPFLYSALGLYIPLIVVNCIILGRAEAYASKNDVVSSLFDGMGMGLGFTAALTIIGGVRELIGAGELFGFSVMPESYVPCSIFVLAPGAFFVLAVLTALQNKIKLAGERKGKDMSKIQSGCSEDCLNCKESGCSKRFYGKSITKAEALFSGADDLEIEEITDDEPEETETQIEVKTETEAKTEAKTETEVKAKAKTEAKAKAKTEAKAKAKTEVKAKAKTEVKAKREAKAETEVKTEAEAKAETEVKTEAEAKAETEVKAEAKTEEEAKTETKAETKTETEVKPKTRRKRKVEEGGEENG